MDRRKALATTGAISLTASAAIIALGSSMGLFGLANDDGSRVGKLSPIDSTVSQPTTHTRTIIVDDPPTSATTGPPATGRETDEHGREAGEDVQHHDAGAATTPTTANTAPSGAVAEHHETEPADDHGGDDNRGPGSADSGHDDD